MPQSYLTLRETIPFEELSYGCGGIKLFRPSELNEGQVGYSVSSDGKSLCTGEQGAWRPNWLVIGYETACGDPLFIDNHDSALPVFTAMHGEGDWEPKPVAVSFEAFAKILAEFARIAHERSNPVALDANPLPAHQRDAFLAHTTELNGGLDAGFWAVLLEC
jgi:hypothetical protein